VTKVSKKVLGFYRPVACERLFDPPSGNPTAARLRVAERGHIGRGTTNNRIAQGLGRSGDKSAQRGIAQAVTITFTLRCGFEHAYSQCAFLHSSLLLWPKGGPRIV
jgi:hypothetical protein